MELSVQNLIAFEALVQTGNMSRAAERLGLSQPALSWSLRQMEEKLGVTLFVRMKSGMALTHQGKILQKHAHELRNDWDRFHSALQENANEPQGTYTLGVFQTLAMFTLPRFYPQLAMAYPHIDLKLAHDGSQNIAEGVIKMKYDFGLVANPPRHPDLTIVDLYPDQVEFWVSNEPSPLQDPQNPVAVVSGTEGMLAGAFGYQEALAKGVIRSTRVLATTDLVVVVSLVKAGAAIGLLPKTIADHFAAGSIKPLAGGPIKEDVISLIWRHDAQRTRASRIIRETIIQALKANK